MKLLTIDEVQKMSSEELMQNYRLALSSLSFGALGLATAAVSHESAKDDPIQNNIELLEKEIIAKLDCLGHLKEIFSFMFRSQMYMSSWNTLKIPEPNKKRIKK